jgi:hypothetical protein
MQGQLIRDFEEVSIRGPNRVGVNAAIPAVFVRDRVSIMGPARQI